MIKVKEKQAVTKEIRIEQKQNQITHTHTHFYQKQTDNGLERSPCYGGGVENREQCSHIPWE